MDAPPPQAPDPSTPPGVDLAQPLLAQVGALGDGYDAWVHASVGPHTARGASRARVEAGDPLAARWPDSLRIFESPLLERLSHIHWWTIPLVWLPIVAALLAVSVAALGLAPLAAAAWAAAGLLAWTLTEYLLHRFVFHWRPRSSIGRKVHFLAHGIHHKDPWDPTRLVFPPLAGLVVAAVLYGLWWLVLPLPAATALMAGLLAGYVVYDLTHYHTHHVRPATRWGRYLKAWHLAHHHKFWNRMFGVSSPLWDLLLGTGKPAGVRSARRSRGTS